MAPDSAPVDLMLQKDLDFMQTWLAKAAVNEVPFKEVVSKSQMKMNLQKVSYKTRLNEYFFGTSEGLVIIIQGLLLCGLVCCLLLPL